MAENEEIVKEIDENAALESASKLRALNFEAQQKREKLVERLVLFGSISFVILLVVLVWTTDNEVSRLASRTFAGGSKAVPDWLANNPAIACRDAKNKNTPWCVEQKSRQDSTWRGIERQGQKVNMFALHGQKGGN